MRRRLQITYATLLAAVLLGLDIPLAITLVSRDTQSVLIDRQNDLARFASLADPALRTGRIDALRAELRGYDALYGIAVAVVDRDGRLVLTSREGVDPADPRLTESIDDALSGQRAGPYRVHWPWREDPLVVAEPVGQGGDTIGVVVAIAPTAALRATTWRNWGVLLGSTVLVLLVGTVAAAPLARWMLRPIRRLDDAARSLANGQFNDRVSAASGPPELRHLAASFNAMAERTATLIERQRSFVSYASHQLRTPLATLHLCVENLKPAVLPPGHDDYRMLAEEINRMSQLCDALLSFAWADVTADAAEDMDAAAVADARVAIWGQAATRAGVRLVRAGDPVAPVRVALQALDQALDALISNAVKFAGAGATVVVSAHRAGPDWVDIDVIDDGPGLSAEGLSRAAEPFWRAPDRTDIEGSGLGIAIADALVRASGGRLDLLAAAPHGLHARIRLPAARPRSVPAPHAGPRNTTKTAGGTPTGDRWGAEPEVMPGGAHA